MSKKRAVAQVLLGAALGAGIMVGLEYVDSMPKYAVDTCVQGVNGSAPPAMVKDYDRKSRQYLLAVMLGPGIIIPFLVNKAQMEDMDLERISCETGEVLE